MSGLVVALAASSCLANFSVLSSCVESSQKLRLFMQLIIVESTFAPFLKRLPALYLLAFGNFNLLANQQ